MSCDSLVIRQCGRWWWCVESTVNTWHVVIIFLMCLMITNLFLLFMTTRWSRKERSSSAIRHAMLKFAEATEKKSAKPRAEIFFTSIVQIHKISSDWNRALASLLHLLKKTLNWRAALLEAKTESCSWLLWLFSSLLFFFVYVARLTYIHPMRSWTGSSIRLFFISEQFSLLIARNQSCSTLLSFARKGGLVSALKKHWNRSGW